MVPSWLVVLFVIEWVLLSFHLSVFVFVIWQMAKGRKMYTTSFTTLYVMQSVSDYASYLMGSFASRLTRLVVPREWAELPHFGNYYFFFIVFPMFYEFFSHTAIAANRYTVIVHPLKHSEIWSASRIKLVVAIIFLMALVCSSVRLFMDVRVIDYEDTYAIVNVSYYPGIVSNILSAGSSIVTCFISCTLELLTLASYRKMSQSFRQQHLEDYRLLIYAMLGLIGHSLLAVYFLLIYSVGIAYPRFNATAQAAYPYMVNLLTLGDPICLFLTSKTLRHRYLKFYLPWWCDRRSPQVASSQNPALPPVGYPEESSAFPSH